VPFGISCWLDGCVFDDNDTHGEPGGGNGGGIFCADASAPVLRDCVFLDNHAYSGGGAYCIGSAAPDLASCTFWEDGAAHFGGGVALLSSEPLTIRECTFAYNGVAGFGGAIACWTPAPTTLENCIIAYNGGQYAVHCEAGGEALLSCCDVYGNPDGDWTDCIAGQDTLDGNITADPLFCMALNPDAPFTLHVDSQCLPANYPSEGYCGRIGLHGVGCPEGVSVRNDAIAASVGTLLRVTPNPFSRQLTVRIVDGLVPSARLQIYNVSGQLVRELTLSQRRGVVTWDGTDLLGRAVATGIYFLRLETASHSETRRVSLMP